MLVVLFIVVVLALIPLFRLRLNHHLEPFTDTSTALTSSAQDWVYGLDASSGSPYAKWSGTFTANSCATYNNSNPMVSYGLYDTSTSACYGAVSGMVNSDSLTVGTGSIMRTGFDIPGFPAANTQDGGGYIGNKDSALTCQRQLSSYSGANMFAFDSSNSRCYIKSIPRKTGGIIQFRPKTTLVAGQDPPDGIYYIMAPASTTCGQFLSAPSALTGTEPQMATTMSVTEQWMISKRGDKYVISNPASNFGTVYFTLGNLTSLSNKNASGSQFTWSANTYMDGQPVVFSDGTVTGLYTNNGLQGNWTINAVPDSKDLYTISDQYGDLSCADCDSRVYQTIMRNGPASWRQWKLIPASVLITNTTIPSLPTAKYLLVCDVRTSCSPYLSARSCTDTSPSDKPEVYIAGGPNQQWTLTKQSDGTYIIASTTRLTGTCGAYLTLDSTNTATLATTKQYWRITAASPGTTGQFYLQNTTTNYWLTMPQCSSSSNAAIAPPANGPSGVWYIIPV